MSFLPVMLVQRWVHGGDEREESSADGNELYSVVLW